LKKVFVFVLVGMVSIHCAVADGVLLPILEKQQAAEKRGHLMELAGLFVSTAGLILAFAGEDSSSARISDLTTVALGGGLVVGGIASSRHAHGRLDRLELGVKYESAFSSEELAAIIDSRIFPGMSELALLASRGNPQRIAVASDSYGIRKIYLYPKRNEQIIVTDGVVTSP